MFCCCPSHCLMHDAGAGAHLQQFQAGRLSASCCVAACVVGISVLCWSWATFQLFALTSATCPWWKVRTMRSARVDWSTLAIFLQSTSICLPIGRAGKKRHIFPCCSYPVPLDLSIPSWSCGLLALWVWNQGQCSYLSASVCLLSHSSKCWVCSHLSRPAALRAICLQ